MALSVSLGDLGEDSGEAAPVQTLPQTALLVLVPLVEMELPPPLEHLPRMEMVERPTLGEMQGGDSHHREDLAGSLIPGVLVLCAFSMNRWEDRSFGSCQWHSWVSLLSPGNGDRASKATGSSSRWCSGACGC